MALSIFLKVCILAATFFSDSQGVRIRPPYIEIDTSDTDEEITLPCIYTTTSTDSPQIEWYLHHLDREEPVMRVSSNGKITTGNNFTGRIKRGENASLLLERPKKNDSGKYGCEVLITTDVPMFAKSIISLEVQDCVCSCPIMEPCGECISKLPLLPGLLAMITFDWLVPIVSFVLMFGSLFRVKRAHVYTGNFCKEPLGKQIFYAARTLALTLGMGLCITSILFVVIFVDECTSNPDDSYKTLGYVCGQIGIFLFLAVVLGNYCFKKYYHPEEDNHGKGGQSEETSLSTSNSDEGVDMST